MQQTIILASLAVVMLTYLFFSKWEDNYVNILTPVMLFGVPAWYVLELLYGTVFGYAASDYAYFYCYLTYALGVLGTVFGYIVMPARPLRIFVHVPVVRVPGVAYGVLGFAVLLYAEILVQFPDLILYPRQIYEVTRTGFGLQFFLSAFAVYFGFVLLLFTPNVRRPATVIFTIVSLIVLYLHGSKGQMLNFFLIALYFFVYVLQKRFDMKRVFVLGSLASVLISGLFYFTSYGNSSQDLFLDMAGYAEYTRNAAMVIDDPTLEPQWGRLTAESRFYVMVPRVLVPDKPRDYGAFWLAKRYYPERFEKDVGAPDFGLGFLYADFGAFAIVYHVAGAIMAGILMKILVTRLRHSADAGTFLLLLVFLDVGLIPTGGGGVPLIFYYLLAHIANIFVPARAKNIPRGADGLRNSYSNYNVA